MPALESIPALPSKRRRWRSRAASTRSRMTPVLCDNRAEGSPRRSSESFLSGFRAGLDSGDFDVGLAVGQCGPGAGRMMRRTPAGSDW
jgi:hypothetical protein